MSGFEEQIRQAAERRQREESQRLAEEGRLAGSMEAQEQRLSVLRSAAAIFTAELTARNIEHDRTFERLRERSGLFGKSKWVAEWTASGWTLVWRQAQALDSPSIREEVMVSAAGGLVYFWGPVRFACSAPIEFEPHGVAGHVSQRYGHTDRRRRSLA